MAIIDVKVNTDGLVERLLNAVKTQPPRPPRRVEVALRKGEDPHVYDVDAKTEISGCVVAIMLRPRQMGTVTLLMYRLDEKGKKVIEDGELLTQPVEAELLYLRGDWEAR